MRRSGHAGGEKPQSLDASLLDRRKVLQCLDAVRGAPPLSHHHLENLSRRLAALGPVAPAALIQTLATERDGTVIGLVACTLEWMVECGALERSRCVGAMQRIIATKTVADETKMRLLVLLNNLGVDVADSRYAAYFNDFAAMVASSREQVLAELAGDESLLGQLLDEIGQLPPDARVSMIEDYGESSHPVVIRLLRILGRSDDPLVGRSIVDCLQEKGTAAAAQALTGLSADALCPETRERALRSLKILKFGGVRPSRASRPARGPVCSSIVSAIDGAGSRMVWIAREGRRTGQVFAIHLMLNEEEGIKDCFGCASMPRTDYDAQVRSLEETGDVCCGRFEYDYSVSLVRDALAINRRNGAPVAPQFLLLMEIFGEDSLEPQVYHPPLEGVDLAALRRNRQVFKQSGRALDLPELETWFVVSEGIYAMARRANRLTEPGSAHTAFRGDVKEQLARMQRQIIRQEMVRTAGPLRRRMEMMADYFLRSEPRRHSQALALLAAAQHLPAWSPVAQREECGASGGPDQPTWPGHSGQQAEENQPAENGQQAVAGWPPDAVPAEENPFLLAMAQRSLAHAQAGLRAGPLIPIEPENGFV